MEVRTCGGDVFFFFLDLEMWDPKIPDTSCGATATKSK